MIFQLIKILFLGMDAPGFCNVKLKESDIHHQHANVHHFQ